MKTTIEVPRDNPENAGICYDVESLIFDVIVKNPNECFHTRELFVRCRNAFGHKYAGLGMYHIVRALDQFFANRLIKRVAPSIWQSVDGPDDEYSERASGFVPEELGYVSRPANYTDCPTVPSARGVAKFNRQVKWAKLSIAQLMSCKEMTIPKAVELMIGSPSHDNPVAVKWAAKEFATA